MLQTPADAYRVFDASGEVTARVPTRLALKADEEGLGSHEHYMLKEIFEQPARLRDTNSQSIAGDDAFGGVAATVFPSRRGRPDSRMWHELPCGLGGKALDRIFGGPALSG